MTSVTSYEAVPYQAQSFSYTHPLRTQTLGALFGLTPASAGNCRVLELGCAAGVNLAAMGCMYPESRFVGVDFSETQISDGKKLLAGLSVANVELLCLDIAAIGENLGEFDYIICHGLFSWVERPLQDKILQICRTQLTPHGIAYVSYNTFPGWYPRRMIREMLLYHADQFRDSDLFLEQARGMVTLFEKALRGNDAPLSVFLKNSLKQIQEYPDWFLRHDVLEDVNEPLYFHQFAEMIEKAGLQYLGDAELPKMVDVGFPEDVRKALRGLSGDIIRFEQYLDFLWNRTFRRSLICGNAGKLTRELAPSRVQECFVASSLRPSPTQKNKDVTRFENSNGGFLETNDPIAVSVLRQLADIWPQSASFPKLFADAEKSLAGKLPFTPETRVAERDHLAQTLWNLTIRDLVEILAQPWPFVTEVSERPRAGVFARYQAGSTNDVTNLRHEVISLDEMSAAILRLLDGSSDENVLLAKLQNTPEMSAAQLRESLKTLASQAFLEA